MLRNPFSRTSLPVIAVLFSNASKQSQQILVSYVMDASNSASLMSISPAELVISPGDEVLKLLVNKQGTLSPQQWVRLGRVLAMVPATLAKLPPIPPQVPQWFLVLQYWREVAGPAAWDIDWALSVLGAEGLSQADQAYAVLTVFFILESCQPYALANWLRDSRATRFNAYLRAGSALMPGVLNAIGSNHRQNACRWLQQNPDLLPPLAPMLAQWATCPTKTLRQAAVDLIAAMDPAWRLPALAMALDQGEPTDLGPVINQLALQGPYGQQILQDALNRSAGGKRDGALKAAIERSKAIAEITPVAFETPPEPVVDRTPLGSDFTDALQTAIDRFLLGLKKSQEQARDKWLAETYQTQYKQYSALQGRIFAESVRNYLNGGQAKPGYLLLVPRSIWRELNLPLLAYVRIDTTKRGQQEYDWVYVSGINSMTPGGYDLRAIAQCVAILGIAAPIQLVADAVFGWSGLEGCRADNVWPFFAQYPQRLDQAFGMAPPSQTRDWYTPDNVTTALQILKTFPALPSRYLPVLVQYAIGGNRVRRDQAQKLLEAQPGVLGIALHTLEDGSGAIRAAGAAWLGRIGDPGAIDGLRQALKREKREQPQAAILDALNRLGDDISAYLTPDSLLAQAKKGLPSSWPSRLKWFPASALPPCRWADGCPVDPAVIQWWVVLADKLKDPLGAGLLPLYVTLLDKPSQQALGTFILDAWIAADTAGYSDEDCRAYAAANVGSNYASYQRMSKFEPRYAAYTKDMVFEMLRKQRANECLGSAIDNKGLLALTTGAPGHYLFDAFKRFVRDYGRRRAQVEALVTAASASSEPAAIQLVLSVARRFKQESVRTRAVELVDAMADRLGWTMDQLADRTVPAAGFDDAGLLTLDFGPRAYTGRITRTPKTGAFTIAVFNPDGKPVSALPQAAANDDPDLAAAARKQLTASKKEITQAVKLQSARLFEAMCLMRTWTTDDWRADLLEHPVMRHLIATLVWQAWGSDGSYVLFRPTVDGELLDAADNAIELPNGRVGLAHRTTVTPEEAGQWLAHLSDYQVNPLFGQFEATAPVVGDGDVEINDHMGWLSDTFAVRTRATKRGYDRGMPEDGGWFDRYTKMLNGPGIRVCIEFTGSSLPEERIPAAVMSLSFLQDGEQMRLATVPKILLAESYADYVYVAEAGAFDPDWSNRCVF